MKIQKSFITVLCIVILTALTLCPVQSEALPYGSIVVTASGFTVDGGASQPLVNLPSYLVSTNTIGILTFGTGIVFPAPPLTVRADITGILIVDAGTEITLAPAAQTTWPNFQPYTYRPSWRLARESAPCRRATRSDPETCERERSGRRRKNREQTATKPGLLGALYLAGRVLLRWQRLWRHPDSML